MTRPRLLDLFCGAGGCSVGYHRAGFDVTGVDLDAHPLHHYPFRAVRADALDVLAGWDLSTFDVIHASPPCHDHSTATGRGRKATGLHGTGWMLDHTIGRLVELGVPFVVENVATARLPRTVYAATLCGSSFGLDLRRHRQFASNLLLLAPPCQHYWQTPRFRSLDGARPRGYLASVVGVHGHTNYAGETALRETAMGIDWMTPTELTQAIPPAYTEHIGHQLLDHLTAAA